MNAYRMWIHIYIKEKAGRMTFCYLNVYQKGTFALFPTLYQLFFSLDYAGIYSSIFSAEQVFPSNDK